MHFFQRILIDFLRTKIQRLDKLIYFSDGSTAQYKNRYNVLNLYLHKSDFNVVAEWHFFATAHAKGPSDGLGGTLKRQARRATLQLPNNKQIQTPKDMYEWAKGNLSGINVGYVSINEMAHHEIQMNRRFKCAIAIKGLRSFHSCIPETDGNVIFKKIPLLNQN